MYLTTLFGVGPKLLIRADYWCVFGCRWAPAWLPAIVWQAYFYCKYHVKAKRCIIHQQLQQSPMISAITEFQTELANMKWNGVLHAEYHATDYYLIEVLFSGASPGRIPLESHSRGVAHTWDHPYFTS